MRIVICFPLEDGHIARIAAASPDAEIFVASQAQLADEMLRCDVFCGHPRTPIPWADVVRQGRLRWIQSSAAGLDHLLDPSVIDSDIVMTSASGVLARQVADQTMALLAGVLRNLPDFFAAQRKREFIRLPTRDLHGARIGIVGMGSNGRRIAEVLKAFQTTLWATDYFPDVPCDSIDRMLAADDVDEMLPHIDALILTAPLTPATRGMIDERRLALLPPGAVLVNVARGPLVVEEALVEALEEGRLWGAGVDVTEVEPLPVESRLWDAPRTIITPHVGGQRGSRAEDMTILFCENLRRWHAGKPLLNKVDKVLGFPSPSRLFRAGELR